MCGTQGLILGPQHARPAPDLQLAYVNKRRVMLPSELQVAGPTFPVWAWKEIYHTRLIQPKANCLARRKIDLIFNNTAASKNDGLLRCVHNEVEF
jgi:hypothetical protein